MREGEPRVGQKMTSLPRILHFYSVIDISDFIWSLVGGDVISARGTCFFQVSPYGPQTWEDNLGTPPVDLGTFDNRGAIRIARATNLNQQDNFSLEKIRADEYIYWRLIKGVLPRGRLRGVVFTLIAIDKPRRRMYEWFDKRHYRAAIRRAHANGHAAVSATRGDSEPRIWCQGDVFLAKHSSRISSSILFKFALCNVPFPMALIFELVT